MPGSNARLCATPMPTPSAQVDALDRLRLAFRPRVLTPPQRFAGKHHRGVDHQEDRHRNRRCEQRCARWSGTARRGSRPGSCRPRAASRGARRDRRSRAAAHDAADQRASRCAPTRRDSTSAAPARFRGATRRRRRETIRCSRRRANAAAPESAPCVRGSRSGKSSLTPCRTARNIACAKVTLCRFTANGIDEEQVRVGDRLAILDRASCTCSLWQLPMLRC